MIAELTYLGLIVMGIGIHLAKHGEPRNANYNFWTQLLNEGITLTILYFCGFFNAFQ